MYRRDRRGDLFVLPALCGLVLILFAAGYIAADFVNLRTLRREAEKVVSKVERHVVDRIRPDLTMPDADDRGTILQSGPLPGAASANGDLRSVLVLDREGKVTAPGSGPPGTLFRFESNAERSAFERAFRDGTVQYARTSPETPDQFRTVFFAPITTAGKVTGVIRLDVDQSAQADMLYSAAMTRRLLAGSLSAAGLLVTLLLLWRYIRGRWRAEDEIRYLAMHDVLTQLPNRAQFKVRLSQALERAFHARTRIAVICIDVDNFKEINDTLGHPVGDRILKGTAERILAVSGQKTTVARLSGDEFAVLINDVADADSLRLAVNRILRNASIPHEIDEREVMVSISMGVATAPDDGNDVDALLKNADLALYKAKTEGRNTVRYFTDDLDSEVRRRRTLEDQLHADLGGDRFTIHYQPQFDLRTGDLIGFEALARWETPTLGKVTPDVFIPAAESCGLIGPLSEWVLLNACKAATQWPAPVKLSVNLSAGQLRTGDIADTIEKCLRWSGLPAHRLEVEITETALLQNTDLALETLHRLRDMGVSIALDDFGTGYSSLSYLARFPIDRIKVDRSFVQRLGIDTRTEAVVRAIVDLALALDIEILAEGVETYLQVAHLRSMQCHKVQGFLFGKPAADPRLPVPEVVQQQTDLRTAAI